MNLENFHEFLKEPANLHRVSYQELKSLVAAYPYSTNLRILLLLKSKLDKHPELSRNLSLAATYTADRSLLYKIMHDPTLAILAQEVIEQEDVLELMDLEKVEAIMSKEHPIEEVAKEMPLPKLNEDSPSWTSDIFEDAAPIVGAAAPVMTMDSFLNSVAQENEIETFADDKSENEDIEVSKQMIVNFTIDNYISFSTAMDSFEYNNAQKLEIVTPVVKRYTYERDLKPRPKDSFSSWLSQFEKDLNRELEVPDINKNIDKVGNHKIVQNVREESEAPKPKEEKIKTPTAKKVAERSLHLSNSIVSETLATLLVKQERFGKAIDMYQKLSLKYPEKSHIFAAEIEKLKNL